LQSPQIGNVQLSSKIPDGRLRSTSVEIPAPSWLHAANFLALRLGNKLFIAVTFGFVFVQAMRKKLPWQVAFPLAVNLVSNLIFTSPTVTHSVNGERNPHRIGLVCWRGWG